MVYLFTLIFCSFFCSRASFVTETIVLDQSRLVEYGSDFIFSPTADNVPAFLITANGVILDFGGAILQQDPLSTFSFNDAIHVATGVTNFFLKNIVIEDFSGYGVSIDPGVSSVKIENANILECGHGGVLLQGTALQPIQGVQIKNLQCTKSNRSGFSDDSNYGMILTNCRVFDITSSSFANNGSLTTGNAYGLNGQNVIGIVFDDCKFAFNNATNNASGMLLNNAQNSAFIKCIFSSNITTGAQANFALGVDLQNSSNIIFEDCRAVSNLSTTGTAAGYRSTAGECNLFKDCIARSNSSNNAAYGFWLQANEQNTSISESHASCQRALIATGTAAGIFLDSVSRCIARQNAINSNGGSGNGYGLIDNIANSSNLIAGNLAFNNSTAGYLITNTISNSTIITATVTNFTNITNISDYINVDIVQ